MNNISANIDNIFLDINQIIEEYSVNQNITLIAVSKKKSVEAIKIAYDSGQRDFGENYLQESVEKIKALKDLNINWHFIGSIQSNKVKHIVENFDWIHSVDSFKIAEKINKFCLQKKINMCIQVNLNDEEIDWLLSNCYQVGLISGKDLVAMGNSIKKSFKALKTIGSLDDLILEESAWSFMALDSIFGMLENRVTRGDRRVKIAGNTGLPRIKNVS